MKIKRFIESLSHSDVLVYHNMNLIYDDDLVRNKSRTTLNKSDEKLISNIFSSVILEFKETGGYHEGGLQFSPGEFKRINIIKLDDDWWIVDVRHETSSYSMNFPFLCDGLDGLKLLANILKGESIWGENTEGTNPFSSYFNRNDYPF
jgi:hypothetical protein